MFTSGSSRGLTGSFGSWKEKASKKEKLESQTIHGKWQCFPKEKSHIFKDFLIVAFSNLSYLIDFYWWLFIINCKWRINFHLLLPTQKHYKPKLWKTHRHTYYYSNQEHCVGLLRPTGGKRYSACGTARPTNVRLMQQNKTCLLLLQPRDIYSSR